MYATHLKQLRILLATSASLMLFACDKEVTNRERPKPRVKPEHYFTLTLGKEQIKVQLALTSLEMQRGLMYRKSLGSDQGMLFVYPQPQKMSFWMRLTSVPLDIGFFDNNGMLREIYPLYPHEETPTVSRSRTIQYALEMNQDWFSTHGVTPNNAMLDLEALKVALRDRGFDPANYRIPSRNGVIFEEDGSR